MLTASEFSKAADPLGASNAIWRAFYPGSAAEGAGLKRVKHVSRYAVAYLGFANWVEAGAFADAFDGYRFQKEGDNATFTARVERAMSQAVPVVHGRPRPLPIEGTIEKDPDYLQFVKQLEEETKRNVSRATSTSVAPAATMFPAKVAVDKDARGKAKVAMSTPLMEDVRARRKERDQKKKAIKPAPRPPRAKGRPIMVADPAAKDDAAAKAAAAAAAASTRRKKQRRGEYASPIKKGEEPIHVPKKVGRLQVNGRRPGVVHGARPDLERRHVNGRVHPSPNVSPHYGRAHMGEMNGYAGSDKSVATRQGRPRAGRGGRARGKAPSTLGGAGHPSSSRDVHRVTPDVTHGPVRLLKKEASHGNKT